MSQPPRHYMPEPGMPDVEIPALLKRRDDPPFPPLPTVQGTEARVCADIARRQQLGLRKYGTSVEANPLPLREWLQHSYEEHLDAAIYLRRAIEQIDREAGLAKATAPTHPTA